MAREKLQQTTMKKTILSAIFLISLNSPAQEQTTGEAPLPQVVAGMTRQCGFIRNTQAFPFFQWLDDGTPVTGMFSLTFTMEPGKAYAVVYRTHRDRSLKTEWFMHSGNTRGPFTYYGFIRYYDSGRIYSVVTN